MLIRTFTLPLDAGDVEEGGRTGVGVTEGGVVGIGGVPEPPDFQTRT